ncbi:vWA domain-containing protein [Cellulomonas shaoxiangyii]|uniref:VWA domain-containing protein n=1 Tax=Cellulomonas shaoxiangyii TaxID=2566013 RepID=A0A4P7SG04_9CELL|nr:VWA domain-containing protein [Cellulomonas shaoxiangyii]QCB92511.1 VWA domain-containing protein [Cellulomonas shaoxiangyii]TGY83398.1 VWA domain-containing protein [Cellulomonas shaoxiangyii]
MTWRAVVPVGVVLVTALPLLVLCVVQALGVRVVRQDRRARPVRDGALRAGPWTWWRRALLVAAVAVVGLTPAVTTTQPGGARAGVQTFFVVDRTGSMAAEDWGPGEPAPRQPGLPPEPTVRRLDGARHDVVSLATDLSGGSFAVIAFADEAGSQLPLTDDVNAVRSWAQTVTQEVTASSTGTLRDRPLDVLRRSLEDAARRDPAMVRLVFYLSDGEQTGEGDAASFAELAPLVDGGAVLGYGTAQGGRMRSYDGTVDPDPPYITDPAGGDAVSRIDEDGLRAVAEELGVPYVHRTAPTPTGSLVADVDVAAIAADGRTDVIGTRDVVWPFALLAALLLAAEAWTWGRASSRRRSA